MEEPNNPHDSLFKATFMDKVIAIDLILNEFPKRLTEKMDFESFTLVPGSHITAELHQFYSDIVYECMFGENKIKVSLLFEHKSFPPKYPHIQLLRYMVEAFFQAIENKEPLQVIIPIIVYHGKQRWKKRRLESYFKDIDPLLLPFIPSFDYLLTDLNELSDEDIMAMNAGLLINTLLLFKHYGEDDYIRTSIQTLFVGTEPFASKAPSRNKIISFLVYLWTTSGIEEEEFSKLLDRLPKMIKNATMTTYQSIIEKGKKEGKKEGKREGFREKENQMISNAIKESLDLEFISRLTGLSVDELKQRIAELGL
ncbi:Rpn family recombination-promoting nuclease/putative transposase [bacterium]|nr:Rpn family recombination-promoting nuclease/putative transposase [bacterium]